MGVIYHDDVPYGSKIDTYSTYEQDTGKKWIDGRTIYRKVVTGEATTTDTGTRRRFPINHNISNLDIVISVNGSFKITEGTSASTTRNYAWGTVDPDGTMAVMAQSAFVGASAITVCLNNSQLPATKVQGNYVVEYVKTS